jgi:hypothetical protein
MIARKKLELLQEISREYPDSTLSMRLRMDQNYMPIIEDIDGEIEIKKMKEEEEEANSR